MVVYKWKTHNLNSSSWIFLSYANEVTFITCWPEENSFIEASSWSDGEYLHHILSKLAKELACRYRVGITKCPGKLLDCIDHLQVVVIAWGYTSGLTNSPFAHPYCFYVYFRFHSMHVRWYGFSDCLPHQATIDAIHLHFKLHIWFARVYLRSAWELWPLNV